MAAAPQPAGPRPKGTESSGALHPELCKPAQPAQPSQPSQPFRFSISSLPMQPRQPVRFHSDRSQHNLQYHKSACMESIAIFQSFFRTTNFRTTSSFFSHPFRLTPSLHSSFRPHAFLLLSFSFLFFFLLPSSLTPSLGTSLNAR